MLGRVYVRLGYEESGFGSHVRCQLEELKCVYVGGGAYAVFIAPLKMRHEEEDRVNKGAAMM